MIREVALLLLSQTNLHTLQTGEVFLLSRQLFQYGKSHEQNKLTPSLVLQIQ